MRFLITYIFFIVQWCCSLDLKGQADTIVISQIIISETSIKNQNPGAIDQHFYQDDPGFMGNTLADALRENGQAFIKSYGFGSLSTISSRGTSAGQNQLLWNGINVSNPMVGLADISLINNNLFSGIDFQKGDGATVFGSGAIGSTINLENELSTNSNYSSFGVNYSSLNNLKLKAELNLSNSKWSSNTRLSYVHGDNEFTYTDQNSKVQKLITHNANRDFSLVQSLLYQPSSSEHFSIHFWYKNRSKDIPVNLLETKSLKNQKDKFKRILLRYRKTFERFAMDNKIAFFQEDILYTDEQISLIAPSTWNVLHLQSLLDYYLDDKTVIKTKLNHRRTKANIANYTEAANQIEFSMLNALDIRQGAFHAFFANRMEIGNRTSMHFIPTITLGYQLSETWDLFLKFNRSFRNPALNDLYWSPGGNPDLLPENGWAQELKLSYQNQTHKLKSEFSIYHRKMNNWILWSPNFGTFIWSAQNLISVRSYGIDWVNKSELKIKKAKLHSDFGLEYTRAINLVTIALPKIEEGEQLSYTPELRLFINSKLQIKKINLGLTYQFVGETQGINDMIDARHLVGLNIDYLLKSKSNTTSIGLRIQNIINKNYFIIERRPMPGRTMELSVNTKIY